MCAKKIRAVLFDCDGVIINSAADISDAVNATLKFYKLPELSYAKLRTFVGNGARTLIERALRTAKGIPLNGELPYPEEKVSEITARYLKNYYAHAVVKTKLYLGFKDAIKKLHDSGIKTGIVTNKPTDILLEVLNYFGIAEYFDAPIGADKVKHLKPAPDGILMALKKFKVAADEAIMVGDSYTDIGAGHAAGTLTAACLKGMGNTKAMLDQKPELILDYAAEIANAVFLANKILDQ